MSKKFTSLPQHWKDEKEQIDDLHYWRDSPSGLQLMDQEACEIGSFSTGTVESYYLPWAEVTKAVEKFARKHGVDPDRLMVEQPYSFDFYFWRDATNSEIESMDEHVVRVVQARLRRERQEKFELERMTAQQEHALEAAQACMYDEKFRWRLIELLDVYSGNER